MLVSNFSDSDQRTLYGDIERQKHIPAEAVEKDWWVTIVLHALFSTEYAKHMVFKGGTSLSKNMCSVVCIG